MVAGGEEQVLDRLPLLGDEERDRLLYEWNHTLVEYPRRMCVQEMFEDQVKRIPGSGGGWSSTSFGQLW